MSQDVHTEHFDAWGGRPFGLVREIDDKCGSSRLFAFDPTDEDWRYVIPADGACYGYVQSGRVRVSGPDFDWTLRRGQWFVTPGSCRLDFDPAVPPQRTRLVVAQRLGFLGLSAAGGPIEERGRLRYIDSCSDTLLAAPPRQGDPCLNLLHFPPGIEQTMHVHPSVRAGVVARGAGTCDTPSGSSELVAGLFFSIPANGVHRFTTSSLEGMDVIAYHPDSDWGPTDEQHPMLTRTLDPETNESMEHDPTAEVVDG